MRMLLVRLICAISLASCSGQNTATPDIDAGETLIVRNDRLFVPAVINGARVEALLDSGAEMTILDADFAQKLGLSEVGEATARGTGGTARAAFAQNVRIEAVGVALEDRMVAIIDLGDVSKRLVGSSVEAILGRDLFDSARFEIDIEEGLIRTVPRTVEPPGVRVPLQTAHGLETFPVSVDGAEPVQALLDLGNGSEVLIGADYAARSGLSSPERIIGRKTGGGIGGGVARALVRLNTLEIAGVIFRDVEAGIDATENAADVNIGVRILRQFRMTLDFTEGAAWFVVEQP